MAAENVQSQRWQRQVQRGSLYGETLERGSFTYISGFHFFCIIHVINTQAALVDEKEQSWVWLAEQFLCGKVYSIPVKPSVISTLFGLIREVIVIGFFYELFGGHSGLWIIWWSFVAVFS